MSNNDLRNAIASEMQLMMDANALCGYSVRDVQTSAPYAELKRELRAADEAIAAEDAEAAAVLGMDEMLAIGI